MKEHGKKGNGGNGKITTVTFLNREQVDFLDKIDKDHHFKFGHGLSRGKILSSLVDCLMKLDINVTEIDAAKEGFCEYILRKAKEHAK